jgi:hypothetical protein
MILLKTTHIRGKVGKMSEAKVRVYHHPNREIRSFLTDLEISAPRVEKIRKPLEKEWHMTLKPLGIIGSQIVKEIMAIQGVQEIQIKPKEVRVMKEPGWSWNAIEGRIIEIVTRALKRKQIRLVKA